MKAHFSVFLVLMFVAACSGGGGRSDGDAGSTAGGNAVDDGGGASCSDEVQNGDETDVDCGGSCDACADGDACSVAGDCTSGSCSGDVCISCSDETQSGDETDVDCGGSCGACDDGSVCSEASDCSSNNCADDVCISCSDETQNGDETDVDCGGSCGACGDGLTCGGDDDCVSGSCLDNDRCDITACADLGDEDSCGARDDCWWNGSACAVNDGDIVYVNLFSGNFIRVTQAGVVSTTASGGGNLGGLASTSDGTLYAGNSLSDTLVRVPAAGGAPETAVAANEFIDAFGNPGPVGIDGDGNVHVLSRQQTQQVDLGTGTLGTAVALPGLNHRGLAFTADGVRWSTSSQNGGELVNETSSVRGGLGTPRQLQFNPNDGRIYIAIQSAGAVYTWDPGTSTLATDVHTGVPGVSGLAFGPASGLLYVSYTDPTNGHSIVRFEPGGPRVIASGLPTEPWFITVQPRL